MLTWDIILLLLVWKNIGVTGSVFDDSVALIFKNWQDEILIKETIMAPVFSIDVL